MKKAAYYFTLCCLITSCDPGYGVDIINKTNKEILLEIKFDKLTLEKSWNGGSYIEFLKVYPNYTGIHNIAFDSINLISTYKILPNSSFPVENGIGYNPTFDLFKTIKIFYKDTIQLKNKDEIKKAFTKVEKGTWELIIE